jgi:hypothetical protein
VHLESDDVFDLLRWTKGDNRHKHDPFIFFCVGPTDFTKTMSVGIEAAARVLGADAVLITDCFNADKFWSVVEPLLSQKKDALNEREMNINAKERQLHRREQDIEKREEGLDQREKFMHRREHHGVNANDA